MREPDYTSKCGTVRLYLGDCLALLPQFEAGSVDAVVTDPPFGVCLNSLPLADPPECSLLCEDECGFNFACALTPFDFEGLGSIDIATCVEFQ